MTEDLLKNASIESAQEVENVQTSENPTQIESANETSAPQNQNDEKPTQPKKKFQLGDVAKCTIVLTVIALVAGLLLGIVNWVTYVDPRRSYRRSMHCVFRKRNLGERRETRFVRLR